MTTTARNTERGASCSWNDRSQPIATSANAPSSAPVEAVFAAATPTTYMERAAATAALCARLAMELSRYLQDLEHQCTTASAYVRDYGASLTSDEEVPAAAKVNYYDWRDHSGPLTDY